MEQKMAAPGSFCGMSYGKVDKLPVDDLLYKQKIRAAVEILKPKPSPYPLVRMGGDQDGAYLIPDDLAGIDACFSPGVEYRKYFEDDLAHLYNIKSHMCDYSTDIDKLTTPMIPGLQTFRKCWLDVDNAPDSVSLENWIAEQSPDPRKDLILQIDIEGAEYRNILKSSDAVLGRFRIISMELHWLDQMLTRDAFDEIIFPFFQKLDAQFVCVHAHPCNFGAEFTAPGTNANLSNAMELTFLRKDRLAGVDPSKLLIPLIPHPFDVMNCRWRPPIFLNDAWLDGPRPLPSRIKMLEEELIYEKQKSATDLSESLEAATSLILRSVQTGKEAGKSEGVQKYAFEPLEEVAAGRNYVLSSVDGGSIAGTVPHETPGYFFHTQSGPKQFITIDLGKVRKIKKLAVGNRLDGCFYRARSLFAILHTKPGFDQGKVYALETTEEFLRGAAPIVKTIEPAVEARYVTICSPLVTILHLSQIEVFAEPQSAAWGDARPAAVAS
jgi:hypothetical protein